MSVNSHVMCARAIFLDCFGQGTFNRSSLRSTALFFHDHRPPHRAEISWQRCNPPTTGLAHRYSAGTKTRSSRPARGAAHQHALTTAALITVHRTCHAFHMDLDMIGPWCCIAGLCRNATRDTTHQLLTADTGQAPSTMTFVHTLHDGGLEGNTASARRLGPCG